MTDFSKMPDFSSLFGSLDKCFDEKGELKPESPKEMFRRYADSLRNALNAADRKMECMETALNAFKCAATRQDIPVLPEQFGIIEDGLTADEMLDKMEAYLTAHMFDGIFGEPKSPETPDEGSREEFDALKAELNSYRERAEKAEARVAKLEKELEAAKTVSGELITGNISELFTDTDEWGGMFKDISGLLTDEDTNGKPVTEYEAALSVLLSGVVNKNEFDAIGGFVNAEYVSALKQAMRYVLSARGKQVFRPPVYWMKPRFLVGWKPALENVRVLAALRNQPDIMELDDILLYGRLREIYAQSNSLDQFNPDIVRNNFAGQINGFIQNLQTAGDSPEPKPELSEPEGADDDLPFEFKDDPMKTGEQVASDISAAIQAGNDKIRAGIEAYKANPAAWKEIIEDRRKAMGVTAANYSDEDAITDILRQKPFLRPENYKTERENVPQFDGFEPDPLLALPENQDENWLNEKLFPHWINHGERYKEYMRLMGDVLPVLKNDAIIGKLFEERKLNANERFPIALAACGGILRYKDAQDMLKYKDIDDTWNAAYRKLVGALAVSCCVQMTTDDGTGDSKRTYTLGSISKETGLPEWVDEAANNALSIKGYSTALLSLQLINRPQGKKLSAPRQEPKSEQEQNFADKDGYYYDAANESYVIIRKGEPLDDSLTEVSEDVYLRGTDYNLPPDRAENLLNACRLWKLVPESVSWDKACDPDYDEEWIAEIRRHVEEHADANKDTILSILNSGNKGYIRALIQQFQSLYRNSESISLETVWKFLLTDDFDSIAPWEPSETADISDVCKAAADEWSRFTGENQ